MGDGLFDGAQNYFIAITSEGGEVMMEFVMHTIPLDLPSSSLPSRLAVDHIVLGQSNRPGSSRVNPSVFSGCFDALTVFSRALDQPEVSQLAYAHHVASAQMSPSFYWSCQAQFAGVHYTPVVGH